jgi:hypothetical protein
LEIDQQQHAFTGLYERDFVWHLDFSSTTLSDADILRDVGGSFLGWISGNLKKRVTARQ